MLPPGELSPKSPRDLPASFTPPSPAPGARLQGWWPEAGSVASAGGASAALKGGSSSPISRDEFACDDAAPASPRLAEAMGPVPRRRVLGATSSSSSSHGQSTSQLVAPSSPSPTGSSTPKTGVMSPQPADSHLSSIPPDRRPTSRRLREPQMTTPVTTRDPIFRKSVSRSVNRSILECFNRDPGLVGDDPLLNDGTHYSADTSVRLDSPPQVWVTSPLTHLSDSEDEDDMHFSPSPLGAGNDLSSLVKQEYARRKSRSQPGTPSPGGAWLQTTPVRPTRAAVESPQRPAFQLTPVMEQGETPFRNGS